jgi:hypothetical protein
MFAKNQFDFRGRYIFFPSVIHRKPWRGWAEFKRLKIWYQDFLLGVSRGLETKAIYRKNGT